MQITLKPKFRRNLVERWVWLHFRDSQSLKLLNNRFLKKIFPTKSQSIKINIHFKRTDFIKPFFMQKFGESINIDILFFAEWHIDSLLMRCWIFVTQKHGLIFQCFILISKHRIGNLEHSRRISESSRFRFIWMRWKKIRFISWSAWYYFLTLQSWILISRKWNKETIRRNKDSEN